HRGAQAPSPRNDSLACFEFVHTMAVGDYVIAKIGRSRLLGIGVVESDYLHDPSRPEYHHTRKVNWLRAANLTVPAEASLPTKTLTDITDYSAVVDFVTENFLESPSQPAPVDVPPFTLEDALSDLFLPREQFQSVLVALRRKKNVILQGPPGVGKTFIARRL